MVDMKISHEELLRTLSYDDQTGIFTWLVSPNRRIVTGSKAGSRRGKEHRYVAIIIDRRIYYAHRLAWFYAYGSWPRQIDHKNCNKLDNRLDNLREATTSQNGMNRPRSSQNKIGLKGVSFHAARGKFIAFKKDGKSKFLGRFDDAQSAHAAYCQAAQTTHGQFARVG